VRAGGPTDRIERERQVARGLEALLGVLGQTALDDAGDRRRHGLGERIRSSWRIACPLSTIEPGKARCPLSSSWRMAPAAKRSLRPSTGSPRTCSGDMYPGVPSTAPVCVSYPCGLSVGSSNPRGSVTAGAALAIPKSRIFT
jgi:hypothetical protein